MTARHVLVDRNGEPRHSRGLLARFFDVGDAYSKGFGVSLQREKLYFPCTREPGGIVHPGVPDIAIVRFPKQDLDDAMRQIQNRKGSGSVGKPAWIDLEHLQEGVVDYGKSDEILGGCWFLTGAIGERSDPGFVFMQTTTVRVDRVYQRGGYTYYGLFHGGEDQPESENQTYAGTSGGPLWQQKLTPQGLAKLSRNREIEITPEDLRPPTLSGVAFYQERRRKTGKYRSEIYCQRLDKRVLQALADALLDASMPGVSTRLI